MKKNLAASLQEARRIHMVGIGGSGMSSLAGILAAQDKKISGSDIIHSPATKELEQRGTTFYARHDSKNLSSNTDLVVYSLAVAPTNPELKEAKRRKIPTMSYPEAVGELTRRFFTIAICGTHGKTTTTAMIAKILIENGFDPTVIVGAGMRELGGKNFRTGKSKLLVLESCEYMRAFLHYSPRIIVLTTLDPDHLDYYKNFEEYIGAFNNFTDTLPLDGYFFANLDDEDVHEVFQSMQKKGFPPYNTFTYSMKYDTSDFHLKDNVIIQKKGPGGLISQSPQTKIGKKLSDNRLSLQIPGLHNRSNALGAYSVCSMLGIKSSDILKSLNNYGGAARRFEIKGKIGDTVVIDDYGHHPVEIIATLQAARERVSRGKICLVFQPHQYSRTKKLFKEFASAFNQADTVIIPNIYEARDSKEDKNGISPESLVSAIQKKHPKGQILYGNGLEQTAKYLKKHASEFDLILTMGAGDIGSLPEIILT